MRDGPPCEGIEGRLHRVAGYVLEVAPDDDAIATALVFGLTELAPWVGAKASGLLATYPVFAAVLAGFAHRTRGPAAATGVLRGLLVGLFGFIGFFAVLAQLLPAVPLALAYLVSAVAAVEPSLATTISNLSAG